MSDTKPYYHISKYLAAKKTVEDRSLNRHVWNSLVQAVREQKESPLKVVEIGSGIGSMIERSIEWDLLTHADYTGFDLYPENVDLARDRMQAWAVKNGYQKDDYGPHSFRIRNSKRVISITFEIRDALEFAKDNPHSCDLLIASSFLDLIDFNTDLAVILSALKPGGLFYFAINFDGATILEPEIDPALDSLIESLWHETMDTRVMDGKPAGDSRCGRHFFEHARRNNAQILDAGASDWTVFPQIEGYPADESYFLHFMIYTIYRALRNNPRLDQETFSEWIQKRHTQIDEHRLVFIAHQLDFLGQMPF
jgi:SAM-dependent methyltransferase